MSQKLSPQVEAWLLNHFDKEIEDVVRIQKEIVKFRDLRDDAIVDGNDDVARAFGLAIVYLQSQREAIATKLGSYLVNIMDSKEVGPFAELYEKQA